MTDEQLERQTMDSVQNFAYDVDGRIFFRDHESAVADAAMDGRPVGAMYLSYLRNARMLDAAVESKYAGIDKAQAQLGTSPAAVGATGAGVRPGMYTEQAWREAPRAQGAEGPHKRPEPMRLTGVAPSVRGKFSFGMKRK